MSVDNVIDFPKKFKRHSTEKDEELQKRIAQEHQKIFCQAMCDEITENILVKLHSENLNVTGREFLKDYKLVSEAIRSMLFRTQDLKHDLQERVDRAVTSKYNKNKTINSITIDLDKL
jgi:hypothetical protein